LREFLPLIIGKQAARRLFVVDDDFPLGAREISILPFEPALFIMIFRLISMPSPIPASE
jgi:hypothetical protein